MDNWFNEIFPSFDSLNPEFAPGYRIINTLFSCFSFHLFNKYNKNSLKSWIQQLNNLAISFLYNPSHALVITDASVKNNIATSIAHIHIYNKPITKTLHHIVNITSSEAELFAIRCSINQATSIAGISKIIVVTNLIHTTKKIFDLSSHSLQSHTAIILKELWHFFLSHQKNMIEF